MKKFFYRLSGRIFATFALGLVLLSLVFGILATHFGKKMVIENSSNELRVLTVVLSQLIQKQFSSLENNLTLIQEDALILLATENPLKYKSELNTYLLEQRAKYQMFEDLMIYDKKGRCIGATDIDWFNINGKDTDFFKNGLIEFNFPSIYGTDSAGKVQLVSSPVINNAGDTIGVLVGIIRLNAVYDLMDQKIGLTENRDAFLLDSDLRFITPGKAGPQELVESHLAGTALKEHLRDESWVGEYLNYDGIMVQGTVLKIPGYSWYIVVERRYEGILQQITRIERVIIGVTVTLILIFLVASLILSNSITQPLLQLISATRSIGRGELHQPVTGISKYEEVDILAAEFERMRRKVASSQGKLLERLEESEQLRIESERLAAIGTLAATMAHEIRNPLNAMNLLVSRIQIGLEKEKLDSVTTDISSEIARLDRLVNSILDYARPIQLERKMQDIGDVIRSSLEMYKLVLDEKNIEAIIVDPHHKCMLNIDEDRMRQCLLNAYQNSIEAMQKSGKIKIEWGRVERIVFVEISDQGEGIHPDTLKKLFSPFYSTKKSGTGLGLSQIQKIVLAHGGQVEIESLPNEDFVTKLKFTFHLT